jgi:hypothetical protein
MPTFGVPVSFCNAMLFRSLPLGDDLLRCPPGTSPSKQWNTTISRPPAVLRGVRRRDLLFAVLHSVLFRRRCTARPARAPVVLPDRLQPRKRAIWLIYSVLLERLCCITIIFVFLGIIFFLYSNGLSLIVTLKFPSTLLGTLSPLTVYIKICQ